MVDAVGVLLVGALRVGFNPMHRQVVEGISMWVAGEGALTCHGGLRTLKRHLRITTGER